MTTVEKSEKRHPVRNIFIATAVGAGTTGLLCAGLQKFYINHPQEADAFIKKEELKNKGSNIFIEGLKDALKTKKINWKSAGSIAIGGALLAESAWLLVEGIRSLFAPKDVEED